MNVSGAGVCPDLADLLDRLEGRSPLGDHVAGCAACSEALADLRATLEAERAAFAPPTALETERALGAVLHRAREQRRGRWVGSLVFSAVAAAALVLILPATLVAPSAPGPEGGSGPGYSVTTGPPLHVNAPDVRIPDRGFGPAVRELVDRTNGVTVGSHTAVICSPSSGLHAK